VIDDKIVVNFEHQWMHIYALEELISG